MKSIVLASGNPGKKAELEQLLAPFGTRVITQVELGITEAEEPHDSFLENALAKARHACFATRLPALADDSGLCVDALGGAPGVYSSRYAGPGATDADRYRKLLDALSGVPWDGRTARFRCTVALAMPGGDVRTVDGACEGIIAFGPAGGNGFGYDPVFYFLAQAATMAQLDPEMKNRISHRGRAAQAAVGALGEMLHG